MKFFLKEYCYFFLTPAIEWVFHKHGSTKNKNKNKNYYLNFNFKALFLVPRWRRSSIFFNLIKKMISVLEAYKISQDSNSETHGPMCFRRCRWFLVVLSSCYPVTLPQRAFNPQKISWWLHRSTWVFSSFSYNFMHSFIYMKICRLLFFK